MNKNDRRRNSRQSMSASDPPPDIERKVSGHIGISGKVEAHLPHSFIRAYETSSGSAEAREKKRFLLECITLASVLLVAFLGLIQTAQSIKSADAAKQSADAAERALELTRAQVLPSIVVQAMDIKDPVIPDQTTPVANSFKNVGGSIAFDVQTFSTFRSVVDGSGPSWEFREFTGSRSSIGNGETYDSPMVIGPQTPIQIAQFHQGLRRWYMTVLVVYSDVTKLVHHRYYCFEFDPETGYGNGCRETKPSD